MAHGGAAFIEFNCNIGPRLELLRHHASKYDVLLGRPRVDFQIGFKHANPLGVEDFLRNAKNLRNLTPILVSLHRFTTYKAEVRSTEPFQVL